jgi:hypothetical protein
MAKRKIRKSKIKKNKQITPVTTETPKPKIKLKPLFIKIFCVILALMLITAFALVFPLGNG